MKEIFSAGDLANAFYITPSFDVIYDEQTTFICKKTKRGC